MATFAYKFLFKRKEHLSNQSMTEPFKEFQQATISSRPQDFHCLALVLGTLRVVKVNLGEAHFEVKYSNFQDVEANIPLANSRANQIYR
eukprot:UN09605